MAKEAKPSVDKEESPSGGHKRKRIVLAGVFAGVLLAEAIGVFVFAKSFSTAASPADAQASEAAASAPARAGKDKGGHGSGSLDPTEGKPEAVWVEVKIGQFRSQNRQGQQAYVLDYSVFATIDEPDRAKLEEEIKAKDAKIRDRFTRIIRAMEPERFSEPDLSTLRTQIKEGLASVLGSELKIQEVLLTDFVCQTD